MKRGLILGVFLVLILFSVSVVSAEELFVFMGLDDTNSPTSDCPAIEEIDGHKSISVQDYPGGPWSDQFGHINNPGIINHVEFTKDMDHVVSWISYDGLADDVLNIGASMRHSFDPNPHFHKILDTEWFGDVRRPFVLDILNELIQNFEYNLGDKQLFSLGIWSSHGGGCRTCSSGLGTCIYTSCDWDGDGHEYVRCGGDDPDDNDPNIVPDSENLGKMWIQVGPSHNSWSDCDTECGSRGWVCENQGCDERQNTWSGDIFSGGNYILSSTDRVTQPISGYSCNNFWGDLPSTSNNYCCCNMDNELNGDVICPENIGDANCDGVVDIYDLAIMGTNFGQTVDIWTEGDLNGDGSVDIGDLALVGANWGSIYGNLGLSPSEDLTFEDAVNEVGGPLADAYGSDLGEFGAPADEGNGNLVWWIIGIVIVVIIIVWALKSKGKSVKKGRKK